MSESALFSIFKAILQLAPEVISLIEKVIEDCKKEEIPPEPADKPASPSKD